MPQNKTNIIQDQSITAIPDVLKAMGTNSSTGLTSTEASQRLSQYGPNTIEAQKKTSELLLLLSHFKSPLVMILLIAGLISMSLGETINASIIILIVLLSVGMDYWQEYDARNAAAALKNTIRNKVEILRDGNWQELFPEVICPGDILRFKAGKIIPADARVLEEKDFFVNQSSLTGESFPIEKVSTPVTDISEGLTALDNIVFMGSSVVSGMATVVVLATGKQTEFGKIAEKLIERPVETDFSRGIREFGYLIMKVTILLVLFIFLVNTLAKQNLLESFMFAVAIAVGLTPELLPMIMSVTMSKGAVHMAKKGVIVKKITAIPNFGSMEVLCTDKTGTLTEDKIALVQCTDLQQQASTEALLYAYLNSHFQSGIHSPLDDAILSYDHPDITTYSKVDEIPFDFIRKRLSIVVEHENKRLLICKGAPEEVLKLCTMDNDAMKKAQQQYESLSEEGFRALAIAIREVDNAASYQKEDEQQLQLVGFAIFRDPPKPNVNQVIQALQDMGVEIKIITGDNQLVTQHICKEIGLPIKGIMVGTELDHLHDEALLQHIAKTTVFARFSPEQKNRIIRILKKRHHAVGYMGDGINDAPSLKTADIGISINNAVEVAKDAADIILTKKDLLVLKEGILEGRKTFANTMKYIRMGISSNFGNMFSMAAATIFLPFLPMLPVQILINNFLYDTSQIAIPTDHVDKKYVVSPQRWDMKEIRRFMVVFGLLSSVFDMLTFYLLQGHFHVNPAQFRTGWFMESLATQILVVFIIRTEQIPFIQSSPAPQLIFMVCLCLAIGWALPYLPIGNMIGFSKLPWQILQPIIILVFVYLLCAELLKRWLFRYRARA
ncbi:Mg2+-importing ATPase [Chitinophaga dinghuensis]|uniref:Magnesium-transporting ATPase, P-type 1 n=1 Tax=Chitinophaga dinghuensis TaxID=1539050 RepID=A0A327W1I0_9BACT|nr:magnesium-translocating P-type ATPase [Chitinophaga dinghuensis]RAJ83147.1 Mg2+-importing ATPase [Chitinophaga dinghuensis]